MPSFLECGFCESPKQKSHTAQTSAHLWPCYPPLDLTTVSPLFVLCALIPQTCTFLLHLPPVPSFPHPSSLGSGWLSPRTALEP